MTNIPIFNPLVGPGSQPLEADGSALDILQLPSGMNTYHMPILPEPESMETLQPALQKLKILLDIVQQYPVNGADSLSMLDMDINNLNLINQVLGEGEVSILVQSEYQVRIQESVLAGVWRIQMRNASGELVGDWVEVAAIPSVVIEQSLAVTNTGISLPDNLPEGVVNAPALFSEISEHSWQYQPGQTPHVINLTLLPQSDADLTLLSNSLGTGNVTILSRGYGNCRISSTNTRYVWWVQYFNSQDKNILNSLEISAIPEVACAAAEDIADSAQRLQEILEVYQ